MRRMLVCLVPLVLVGACSNTEPGSSPDSPQTGTTDVEVTPTDDATATSTASELGAIGEIVFERFDESQDSTLVYTVNPDAGEVQQLLPEQAQAPRWSPDGTEIALFCCDDGMAAHIVDAETGELRTLPPPDPALETHCGGPWSPDGTRLTCFGLGLEDPSLNGIYSINSTDGGDLRRITSAPGMDDYPGDYSPDGNQLVFMRAEPGDEISPIGMFVINVDGTGLRPLTPALDMVLDDTGWANGRWSPTGNEILFVARTSEDHHKAIWVVNADGGTPQQLPINPACGGPFEPGQFGCYAPSWSPDGEQIVFTRSDGTGESIYTVNADGSGLVQVTDGEDDQPHWGPRR